MGGQDRGVPRNSHPRPPRRPGHGRLRPFPPAVAGQHAAVPGGQGAVLRRELLQRGTGVRPAPDVRARPRGSVRVPAAPGNRRRLRPRVQQRAADRPQHHLPAHHVAAGSGPADRPHLHQHLRAAAAAAEALRRAGQDYPAAGRVLAERPAGGHHRHRSPVAGAGRAAPVRPARPRPRVRPQGGRLDRVGRPAGGAGGGQPGQPVAAGQRDPRLHGFHADDGRGRRQREGRLQRFARPVPHHGGLFHLVSGGSGMSKYLLNKFLYTIDRDPDLVERYRADPIGTVAWWEAERANVILNLPELERSTWLEFTDAEREALATHDFVKLFELGAHNFLTLTLFIAMFERDYDEPLGFQLEYARRLSHFSLPYPDIST